MGAQKLDPKWIRIYAHELGSHNMKNENIDTMEAIGN